VNIRLASLHVHPIKSARGLSVERALVGPRGLAHDRAFMIVDRDGRFVTQRAAPRLALVTTALDGGRLIVRAPGLPPLEVPLAPAGGEPRRVRVWDDDCDARSLGAEAARWLSEFLGAPHELVYLPPSSMRPVDPDYAPPDAEVGFADGFPFLLISRASLDELNRRLARPITMERFRPNLVIDGCAPFAEDAWRRITIGGLPFSIVKPCARCTIPNVDPETAETGDEPLRTLATFRARDHHVYFGQNVLGPSSGTLSVGDAVEVLD